jgi:hypothetical protein
MLLAHGFFGMEEKSDRMLYGKRDEEFYKNKAGSF